MTPVVVCARLHVLQVKVFVYFRVNEYFLLQTTAQKQEMNTQKSVQSLDLRARR